MEQAKQSKVGSFAGALASALINHMLLGEQLKRNIGVIYPTYTTKFLP